MMRLESTDEPDGLGSWGDASRIVILQSAYLGSWIRARAVAMPNSPPPMMSTEDGIDMGTAGRFILKKRVAVYNLCNVFLPGILRERYFGLWVF
jgi:hypothetical protein